MRKFLVLSFACGFLVACGGNASEETSSDNEEQSNSTVHESEEEEVTNNSNQADSQTTTEGDEKEPTDTSNEELSESELEALRIPTVPMESPYDDDGNIKHAHTQIEIVDEYMDEDGRIYFGLDEDPVRNITNPEDENIVHVTNYSDVFINIVEAEAFQLDEDLREEAYKFVMLSPPQELEGKDPSEYRTWEEATNLERGVMQMIYLTTAPIHNIDYIVHEDLYNHDALPILLEEFEKLGSPMVLFPAPQTVNDMQLFELIQVLHQMWGQLGQFENPAENKEEFEELYFQVRQETNDLIVRMNFLLSEEM
ncbi:hypothetical protein [Shouchella hunanensis]|uniref:Lipoprotein n=2 Tax=Shouchella TaxID=2893057 RepID=A0ABY7WCC7_9BACI|nr:hypothetical protein [Shouchella hunanensis]WDF05141.1 hypothetical protein PQ477_06640 [Shouchella hunanensis]